ncbi:MULTISPECIES: hypothetical protein [unclassified Streptomyces]|uniref:hypothetical protein n=1 Tax=unclassified Streptomyces TaxID=2593676 RepID=UPI0016617F68|nr:MULTISPECIES: hypothetical protein [unclassified Streptomyces]MBD0708136.1 hypothetical protein [Streptomyces sp. CBMA291]MBD0715779.1 hypothetical protein [Streptomyces sp. CBMA370]
MRRTFTSVTVGLALCLLLTACGGGEGDEPRVTAEGQCDDTLSPQAAKALASVLGTERFQSLKASGVEQTAKGLIGDQEKSDKWASHPPLCEIAPADAKTELSINFWLYHDEGDFYGDVKLPERHFYPMGREASSDNKAAYLFLECSSPRMKDSDTVPARIQGTLTAGTRGTLPPNTPATREAYLTVLHSVSLALVRNLGCENDAGLPAKPVLTERK